MLHTFCKIEIFDHTFPFREKLLQGPCYPSYNARRLRANGEGLALPSSPVKNEPHLMADLLNKRGFRGNAQASRLQ